MKINIRPVQDSDWPALWPLLEEMGQVDSQQSVKQRAAYILRQPDHLLAVAESDRELVGYAWAQDYGPHLRSGHSIVRMHDLLVISAQRRRGVGKQLLNAVKDWAAARGCTWLQWQASRAALPFYERLGLWGDPCPDPEHPFFEVELR